jgi:uncharacterized damage-inducible protein DinB
MQDDLKSLFAYNRWANRRVLEACRALGPGQYEREPVPGWSSVRATLVHLADSSSIWARRIDGETVNARRTEADVPTLDDVGQLLDRGHDAFDRLIATLSPERVAAAWSYRNFEGKVLELPLWAVLRHVVNHATYHRGQIASKFGRLGVTPPPTDLVVWAIEKTHS